MMKQTHRDAQGRERERGKKRKINEIVVDFFFSLSSLAIGSVALKRVSHAKYRFTVIQLTERLKAAHRKRPTDRPTEMERKNPFGAIMLRLSNIDIKLKMVTVSLCIFYIDVMKVLVHHNNSQQRQQQQHRFDY